MKHWATLFLMGFFLFSCASTIGTLGLENKVKKLRIDMTQEEAFQVVGENYQIMMVSKTEEGDLEILRYISLPIESLIFYTSSMENSLSFTRRLEIQTPLLLRRINPRCIYPVIN